MADSEDQQAAGQKKSGLVLTLVAVAMLSVVGVGGGWLIGGMLAPKVVEAAKAESEAKHGEKPTEETHSTRPNILALDPIITNLSYPSDNWIRIEVALLFRDQVDTQLADTVNQDILAYLRTVSLQQIEGPRGFQYLRQDLVERAKLRSEGKVTDIIFRTFVIE